MISFDVAHSRPFSALTALVGTTVLVLGQLGFAGAGAASASPSATVPSTTASSVATPEAVALSRAKRNGAAVRVDALTTETRTVDASPDGTLTATVSSVPVRMRSGAGWADIDLTLADDGTEVRPRMTPLDVKFGRGGDARMSIVGDRKGHSVEQSWPYGRLPAPILSGDRATYPDVLPGVDLVQIAGRDRMGQVFKVKTAAALADPRLKDLRVQLKAAGAGIEPHGAGGVAVRGTDTGAVELSASKGTWWDSAYPDTDAADPGGPGVSHPFDLGLAAHGQGAFSTGIAAAVGDPKGLSFPLYIDPDFTNSRRDYLYVDSAFPNTSYWNGQYTDGKVNLGFLPAAWDTTYGVNHSAQGFYQFDTSASLGAVILAARFNVTDVWSSSCTPTMVRAFVTYGVTPSTTWNNRPGKIQQLDAKSFANGNSASCPAATVGFDMMAAKDKLPTTGQWTVGLYADNDNWDQLTWKRFDNGATITVQYGHPPKTPKVTAVSACNTYCTSDTAAGKSGYTRTAGPVFTVSGSDVDVNDGWITAWMSVTKEGESSARWWMAAGQPIWLSPSAGSGSWGYGSTGQGTNQPLPDGHYKFSVTLVDQQGLVSGSTDYWFWVDTAAPPIPQITAPAALSTGTDSNGAVGSTSYTFTITEPAGYAVKGFVYAVTDSKSDPGTPDATMACGTAKNAFVMVCPNKNSTTFNVAAIDASTTVRAWALDAAGNISNCTAAACTTKPNRSETGSMAFSVGNTAAAPTKAMNVTDSTTGTARTGMTTGFDGLSGPCSTEPAGDYAPEGFSYSGGYSSGTAGAAVDPSQSFTASVWACPSGTGPSTVLAQTDSSGNSQLRLGVAADGHWALTTRTGTGTETTVEGTGTAAAGQWAFVNAQYDRINAQMRITVANANSRDTWVVAAANQPSAPGSGTQVYLGKAAPGSAQSYTGLVTRPVLTQAVLTAQQVQDLWTSAVGSTSQVLY